MRMVFWVAMLRSAGTIGIACFSKRHDLTYLSFRDELDQRCSRIDNVPHLNLRSSCSSMTTFAPAVCAGGCLCNDCKCEYVYIEGKYRAWGRRALARALVQAKAWEACQCLLLQVTSNGYLAQRCNERSLQPPVWNQDAIRHICVQAASSSIALMRPREEWSPKRLVICPLFLS